MNKVLFIGGPTGIGKSSLAIELAKLYNGSIVGADSMQIYRGLNIGTGKVKEDEKQGITHAMIDIVLPQTNYSVQQYCNDAIQCLQKAAANGKLPIVVGGTGQYINALLHPQNFAGAAPDKEVREKYVRLCAQQGSASLHRQLEAVDPQSAAKISPNDQKRIIRALEIFETTGRTKSQAAQQNDATFDYLFLLPELERQTLYVNIEKRIDVMLQEGWVDEVKALRPYWNERCMEAIGYREIITALQNNIDPRSESVVNTIKQNTRRYAKRQITFFKWIRANKVFLQQPYLQNATGIVQKWLNNA